MNIRNLVATFLILCLVSFIAYGSVFAKHIPTTKALIERLNAEKNGFVGDLNSFWRENNINEQNPGNIELWNKIASSNKDLEDLNTLANEVGIIIQYHDITGGSQESTANFEKWIKELHEKWPLVVKELEDLYIKVSHGDLNEAQKFPEQL